jgi:hypothetical protein
MEQEIIARFANRTDAYGTWRGGAATTVKEAVTTELVRRHVGGLVTIGLHASSVDGRCKWTAWDLDAHAATTGDGVAERNRTAADSICLTLERLGCSPMLEDSDRRGGFHVWVFWDHPVPQSGAHALAANIAETVEGVRVETFPKQAVTRAFGNWLRLPGLHHRHGTPSAIANSTEDGDLWPTILSWPLSPSSVVAAAGPPELAGRAGGGLGLTPMPSAPTAKPPVPAVIVEGGRNEMLMSMAGTMWRRGFDRESLRLALLMENGLKCRPPLDEAEVLKIAESVTRYPQEDLPLAAIAGNPAAARAAAETTIEQVRSFLPTVDLRGLIRRGRGEAERYYLVIGDAEVRVGTAGALLSASSVRAALLSGCSIVPKLSQKKWDSILSALVTVIEDQEIEEDTTPGGLRILIDEYLDACPPCHSREEAASCGRAPFVDAGRLWINIPRLLAWARANRADPPKGASLYQVMRSCGWRAEMIRLGDDDVLRYWSAPLDSTSIGSIRGVKR